MGAKDWHSLDQLAKNSTIQVTRLSRSSSSCRRGVGLSGGWQAEPPGTPRGGDTHIYGLVAEILDVLRAHVEGGLAGHEEHCNDSTPEPPRHLESPGWVWDEGPPSPEQPGGTEAERALGQAGLPLKALPEPRLARRCPLSPRRLLTPAASSGNEGHRSTPRQEGALALPAGWRGGQAGTAGAGGRPSHAKGAPPLPPVLWDPPPQVSPMQSVR